MWLVKWLTHKNDERIGNSPPSSFAPKNESRTLTHLNSRVWISKLCNDQCIMRIAIISRVLKPMLVSCQFGNNLCRRWDFVNQYAWEIWFWIPGEKRTWTTRFLKMRRTGIESLKHLLKCLDYIIPTKDSETGLGKGGEWVQLNGRGTPNIGGKQNGNKEWSSQRTYS